MMGGLDTTIDGIAWVITAYTIGNVLMIPMTRYASDRLGRQRYFTLSIFLFTLFSVLCGLSRDLLPLVVFRLLQGMAGAAFFATSQTLIIDAFPPEKIAIANAIFGVGVSLGPALGPLVGGYLVYHESWPWIFFINLPIGLALIFLAFRYVPDSHYTIKDERLDLPGITLLLVAIPCIQFAIENGQRYNWFSSLPIRMASIGGALCLLLFVLRELTAKLLCSTCASSKIVLSGPARSDMPFSDQSTSAHSSRSPSWEKIFFNGILSKPESSSFRASSLFRSHRCWLAPS